MRVDLRVGCEACAVFCFFGAGVSGGASPCSTSSSSSSSLSCAAPHRHNYNTPLLSIIRSLSSELVPSCPPPTSPPPLTAKPRPLREPGELSSIQAFH